ncbi:MAG TPA: CHAT domain-containing protein [Pyrinomonadaceae bacterium]
MKEIQSQLLDENTVLLEYSLGEDNSYVWAISPNSLKTFTLPKRTEVEDAARRVYDLVTASHRNVPGESIEQQRKRLLQADEDYPVAIAALSRMLLGPVGSELKNKRLLIVAEGVDQAREVKRSAEESGLSDFPRLRFSREEANQIMKFASRNNSLEALDFSASRANATSTELQNYRIVHFATHGIINSRHAELSGVVLSLVDQNGKPQNGFLRLYDIYNEGLLSRRLSPAAALRSAQVAMLQDKRWHNPRYWAAFTIQGEWK